MQTKTSYRVLKWTLLGTVVASFMSACVVTSDPDGFGDGGDGNTSDAGEGTTAGKPSGGGGKGGTGGTGGSGGTTAGIAGQATAGAGGEGGATDTYQPGVCVGDATIEPSPSMLPSCTPNEKDEADACLKCVKANCCDAWQECDGDTPATACGWGLKYEDPGQYDCIRACFPAKFDELLDSDDALEACSAECTNQCEDVDNGLPFASTSTLVDCSSMKCGDECFPLPP